MTSSSLIRLQRPLPLVTRSASVLTLPCTLTSFLYRPYFTHHLIPGYPSLGFLDWLLICFPKLNSADLDAFATWPHFTLTQNSPLVLFNLQEICAESSTHFRIHRCWWQPCLVTIIAYLKSLPIQECIANRFT